ncbi:MAG: ABC transporter ATP-binding protein [Bacilli bacterium]
MANILEINELKQHFVVGKTKPIIGSKIKVLANDGISVSIAEGETLGLVGESGCGKSTFGRTITKLYKPTAGTILFDGQNITEMKGEKLRKLRKDFQIIFQDPYSSLDPKMTVGAIIGEALVEHKMFKSNSAELENYIIEIMEKCGLAGYMINRYPHQFSGGQRQRIGIARAIALKPKFIVCDEAVSALDVSIQSQIINLLVDLRKEFNFTYLFISHDLNVVRHISDRVGVMYLGKIVELADSKDIYNNTLHPYSKMLLEAVPKIDGGKADDHEVILGDIPSNSSVNPIKGCKFHTRCPIAEKKCSLEVPLLEEKEKNHFVACHLVCKNEEL